MLDKLTSKSPKNIQYFIVSSSLKSKNNKYYTRGTKEIKENFVGKDFDELNRRMTYDSCDSYLIQNEIFTSSNFKDKNPLFSGSFLISDSKSEDKDSLLSKLEEVFNNDVEATILFLIGHGKIDENGKACLLVESTNKHEKLYYKDITDTWKARKSARMNQDLMIVIDACHSGGWVEENLEDNHADTLGACIQASCLKSDKAFDVSFQGKTVGLLIYNLAKCNNNQVDKVIEDSDQKPCYNGNSFLAKRIFNINALSDDWTDSKDKFHSKTYDNGDKYEGQWRNDKRNGKGIFFSVSGNRYEGDWKNDFMHGKGMFFWSCAVYFGEWKNHHRNGKGSLLFINNDHYVGGWLDDLKDDKGIYNWANGNKFDGYWRKDKRNGLGVMQYKDGSVYNGNWKDDLRDGFGVFTWANGAKYEGNWSDSKRNGQGKMIFSNGDSYNGEWLNDQKHGKGIYLWADGEKYEGDWIEDRRTGLGKFTWDSRTYEGDWKYSQMHGKGKMLFSSGDSYEGDWIEDNKHGLGVYICSNGDKYEGSWKNNQKCGIGNYFWENGDKFEGEWENNKRNGKGKMTFANGDTVDSEWKDDARVIIS